MEKWKRVRSATEWGFFFGILSWLLATGITNKIPTIGIWGIILSRTLVGFIIGYVKWEFPRWARGLIIGGVVNLFLSILVYIPLGETVQQICFGWERGFWLMLITGMVFGILTEVALVHRGIRLGTVKTEHWWEWFL